MEEIIEHDGPEMWKDKLPVGKPDEPKVRFVLLVQFGLCLAMALLGAMLYGVIAMATGWGTGLMEGQFSAHATAAERWQMRTMLGLSHLTTFLLAGFATVWLFYRSNVRGMPDWRDYLRIRRFPGWTKLGLALLLMIVSTPLVLYSYNINKALPLPESFRLMEAQTTEALKGLLIMDSPLELLGNLAIIAFLPALGEELVFRGVLQQQLMRRIANPWVALLLSAAVFSFIHFQFEGFLPRMLLGLFLGWLYWRTQNFWIPVTAHFFNNGLQVAGQYLYAKQISAVDLEQDIEVPWFAALISALLIWGVIRLIRKSTDTQSS